MRRATFIFHQIILGTCDVDKYVALKTWVVAPNDVMNTLQLVSVHPLSA